MDERQVGALAGGGPDHRDLLRPHRALALHGVVPALAIAAGTLALPGGDPVRRLAASTSLAVAAGFVFAPLVGTGPRPLRSALATAAGAVVGLVLAAVLVSGDAGAAAAAGAALAGFLLLLAGLADAIARLARRPAAGVAVAGLLGAAFAASFHLGDPFLEWGGPGIHSAFAMRVLHAVNPLSGAIGDGLGFDWLHELSILYRGFPGSAGRGLTAAPFYYYRSFPWWGTALLHGGVGLSLLSLRRNPFSIPPPNGAP